MSKALPPDPRALLGLSPASAPLQEYLKAVSMSSGRADTLTPDIRAYSDALYMNYFSLGLSLMFVAKDGKMSVKEAGLKGEELQLDSIDIYNIPEDDGAATRATPHTSQTYSTYPIDTLELPLSPSKDENSRSNEIGLSASSTGKDIVEWLGEPDRKGGGAGPSSGSIGIWCEWSRDGIMIEFGGNEARGPQAWDRGKDAKWRVLTLFRPKES